MNQSRNILFLTLDDLTPAHASLLKRSFWFASVGLVLFFITQTNQRSIELIIESYALMLILLIPSWLWATQQIRGLPVAPTVAVINIMYIIYPIINDTPALQTYTIPQLSAALAAETICMVLMIVVWYCVSRHPVGFSSRPRMLNPANQFTRMHYKISLLLIFLSICFNVSKSNGAYYDYVIQYVGLQWQNTIGSFLSLIEVVACFTICLNIGERKTGFFSAALGLTLIAMNMLASTSMLLLSVATFQFFACFIGYFIARGRVPWTALLIFFFCLNILHQGKGAMREKYWSTTGTDVTELDLADYPAWYAEWINDGWSQFTHKDASHKESSNLLERVSIIQMILLAQTRVPEQHDFLRGETYAIIPGLLVPRWINPDKARSHEGQAILSVSLGLQQRQATERTFIAWGLLAEAWANFGWLGPPLLGLFLGLSFGKITAWSLNCPFASYRFIVCALCFFISIVSIQFCASILVTTLFQTVVVITVLCFIFMDRYDYIPTAREIAAGMAPQLPERPVALVRMSATS